MNIKNVRVRSKSTDYLVNKNTNSNTNANSVHIDTVNSIDIHARSFAEIRNGISFDESDCKTINTYSQINLSLLAASPLDSSYDSRCCCIIL